jgi:hypothetical protein
MTEGQWFEVTYAQFASLLGFGRNDASHPQIHMAFHLDVKDMKFMYPKSKRSNCGTTTDLLHFYVYTNRLFRKTMIPREGDDLKIPSYNKNILAVMAPNGYELSVFDFIWEEIKAISKSTLKSCGYAPYIMHIIERVTSRTFGCDKEHHQLRIKNDLKTHIEGSSGATPSHDSSPPRAGRGSGRQSGKPPSSLRMMFGMIYGLCKSQHAADVRAHHERQARKKDTKSLKQMHAHMNLQPPRSPITSEVESFDARMARYEVENPWTQWYSDTSFSGCGFDLGGDVGTPQTQPPPYETPPINDEEDEEEDCDEDYQ